MRILVVEDEEAIARGLRFNFEREGYQVDLVSSGPAALELYESAQPPIDLVVLDLMLPEMSGYEICRALRRLDLDIPVLALTARTLSEDKIQAFDCGVDQYMTKPFSLPELLSRVLPRFGAALFTLFSFPIYAMPVPMPETPVLMASWAGPWFGLAMPTRPPCEFLLAVLDI